MSTFLWVFLVGSLVLGGWELLKHAAESDGLANWILISLPYVAICLLVWL